MILLKENHSTYGTNCIVPFKLKESLKLILGNYLKINYQFKEYLYLKIKSFSNINDIFVSQHLYKKFKNKNMIDITKQDSSIELIQNLKFKTNSADQKICNKQYNSIINQFTSIQPIINSNIGDIEIMIEGYKVNLIVDIELSNEVYMLDQGTTIEIQPILNDNIQIQLFSFLSNKFNLTLIKDLKQSDTNVQSKQKYNQVKILKDKNQQCFKNVFTEHIKNDFIIVHPKLLNTFGKQCMINFINQIEVNDTIELFQNYYVDKINLDNLRSKIYSLFDQQFIDNKELAININFDFKTPCLQIKSFHLIDKSTKIKIVNEKIDFREKSIIKKDDFDNNLNFDEIQIDLDLSKLFQEQLKNIDLNKQNTILYQEDSEQNTIQINKIYQQFKFISCINCYQIELKYYEFVPIKIMDLFNKIKSIIQENTILECQIFISNSEFLMKNNDNCIAFYQLFRQIHSLDHNNIKFIVNFSNINQNQYDFVNIFDQIIKIEPIDYNFTKSQININLQQHPQNKEIEDLILKSLNNFNIKVIDDIIEKFKTDNDHSNPESYQSWINSQISKPNLKIIPYDKLILPNELSKQLEQLLINPYIQKCIQTESSPILLQGISGIGKTTIASSILSFLEIDIIQIKPSDILSKFQGESEKNIRDVFQRASTNKSALVFEDLDMLLPTRTSEEKITDRLVNTFLTLLDGFDSSGKKDWLLVCTSNRPWLIDPAVLRSGRLDTHLYIDTQENQQEVLIQMLDYQLDQQGIQIQKEEELEEYIDDIINKIIDNVKIEADTKIVYIYDSVFERNQQNFKKIDEEVRDIMVNNCKVPADVRSFCENILFEMHKENLKQIDQQSLKNSLAKQNSIISKDQIDMFNYQLRIWKGEFKPNNNLIFKFR